MCGITVCVRRSTVEQSVDVLEDSADWHRLIENNAARGECARVVHDILLNSKLYPGPDSQCTENVVLPLHSNSNDHDITVSFVASTLHLRGATLVRQPHVSERAVFCWNGEVCLSIHYNLVIIVIMTKPHC